VIMRLLILRQTSIVGQPARVGDVVEVNDRDARLLINSGKAEAAPIPAAPAAVVVQDPEPVKCKPRQRRAKSHGTA
jgi:hypothetical protein